jgi:hypothetical protein
MEKLLEQLKAEEQYRIKERELLKGKARLAIGNYMQGLVFAIYKVEAFIAEGSKTNG